MDLRIVELDRSTLSEWAGFIANHNRQCVASLGGEPEELREQIASFVDGSFCACAAYVEGVPLGLFVAEYDVDLRRAWLMGPVIAAHDEAIWRTVADALLARIVELLPPSVQKVQFFFDERAKVHAEFALGHGFVPRADASLSLRLALTGTELSIDPAVGALSAEKNAEFAALHEGVFASPYFNGRQLLEQAAAGRRWLFVHRDGDAIDGYITGETSAAAREAYVEFVGVREDKRRSGIATALLNGAARHVSQGGAQSMRLTVRSTNEEAVRLYAKLGFRALRSMRAFDRERLSL